MRRICGLLVIACGILAASAVTGSAQDGCGCSPTGYLPTYSAPGPMPGGYAGSYSSAGSCPWWRPCGPGNSNGGNRLFAQGFYGADFRPACANHDACLASGLSRKQCDRQFLADMQASCATSSNPELCMRKAQKYYIGARLFGGLYH